MCPFLRSQLPCRLWSHPPPSGSATVQFGSVLQKYTPGSRFCPWPRRALQAAGTADPSENRDTSLYRPQEADLSLFFHPGKIHLPCSHTLHPSCQAHPGRTPYRMDASLPDKSRLWSLPLQTDRCLPRSDLASACRCCPSDG